MPRLYPAIRTPVTTPEMAQALYNAWTYLFDACPSDAALYLLLAQWANETGWGKSMWSYNIGNVKHVPAAAKTRSWCFFSCTEVLSLGETQRLKTDPRVTVVRAVGPNSNLVRFDPDHPACCFRAYESLAEGALDYLYIVKGKFGAAWATLGTGNPEAFVRELKRLYYFTGSQDEYLRSVAGCMRMAKSQLRDFAVKEPGEVPEALAPMVAEIRRSLEA